MRRALTITLLAALLVACRDNDTTEEPDATLRASVETYTAAFGDGDAETVVGMVSPRCLTELGKAAFREAVAASTGPLEVTSYDEQIDGDNATVSYSVSDPTLSQSGQRWTSIDNTWHWDDC